MDSLCLLTVHAHPDDESSKGAGTVARYRDEGIRSVLVCCTGGEEGEVLNPALDAESIRHNIAEVRRAELARAAEIIGYETVHHLGYRDSGMPGSDANKHPDCFAMANLDEAVERLVRIIRHERPQVIVTYPDDQQGYQHPDHLRVHDVTLPAWRAAGDPQRYPGAGEPWMPLKLYYSSWSRARVEALHSKHLELGMESPFGEHFRSRPSQDDRITAKVDVGGWFQQRYDALRAHETQVDPTSPFWFGLAPEVAAEAYPYEDYILADARVSADVPETCLFSGVSTVAGSRR